MIKIYESFMWRQVGKSFHLSDHLKPHLQSCSVISHAFHKALAQMGEKKMKGSLGIVFSNFFLKNMFK